MPAPYVPGARYRERLHVPPAWWFLGSLFCLSLGFAVGWYVGLLAGLLGGLVPLALLTAFFLSYGGVRVEVVGSRFTAGRASLELGWVGSVSALSAEEARIRRGPGADVRAYLLLRPYVPAAVEVTLTDPADPAPYWLVSTRRPGRLAAAIEAARTTDGSPHPGPVGSAG